MKVYNETKAELIEDYDLEKGYLKDDTLVTHIPYSPRVDEVSHEEIIAEYPNGGVEAKIVIDVEAKAEVLEHDETEGILVYIPFTEAELEERKKDEIRQRRETECFAIINRGTLWYSRLTDEQIAELNVWYSEWLDAPATGVIPERPTWLE